jgi:F-type H+-transporting ATPase subunit delta
MKSAGSALYGSLPRRYARAFIQIAQEDGGNQVEAFGRSLEEILQALESSAGGPSFLKTLADDTLDVNERLAAVQELADKAGLASLVKNFLSLLVHKERIAILPEIVREYRRFQDEILGIVRVSVVTPSPPEAGLLDRVASALSRKLKKKIVTRGEDDASLIGGVVLRVDHTVYDGSIRKELERIKDVMMKG